jgi:hypothetical protein
MYQSITGAELHEEVFHAKDIENTEAVEGLLLALAEGKPVDSFLAVLKKSSKAAYYELSGEKAKDEWRERYEHDDYIASVNYAAMM